jgi:hypothetical protein
MSVTFFPAPSPLTSFGAGGTTEFQPSPSRTTPTLWKSYWLLLLWYFNQGGRVAVSSGIAAIIYLLYVMLPGLLAFLVSLAVLVLMGQYDVQLTHTKRD